ncbi:MAG: DUF1893 domain-containing protein [Rikenellaceae bacterium]
MTIERLIEELHRGEHTLIVAKGEEVRRFSGRGVSDIYALFRDDSKWLCGATIVDKIIGKGAAAIMIMAKPKAIYTDVISQNGLALFRRHGVEVSYAEVTPHIIRRDGAGWCPVELLCRDIESAEECIAPIGEFIGNY